MNSYHVQLETFTERRTTSWETRPHTRGSMVDGPENGPVPGAWDIGVSPPAPFADNRINMTMPHSESVRQCSECYGTGNTQCSRCHGRGSVSCSWCNGRGYTSTYDSATGESRDERCHHCHNGRERCHTCNGGGMVTCDTCDGCGRVVLYLLVSLTWLSAARG